MGIKTFVFQKLFDSVEVHLKQPLSVPIKSTTEECFLYISELHNVPAYAHEALRTDLDAFLRKEKQIDFEANYGNVLSSFLSETGDYDINTLCTAFNDVYEQHTKTYRGCQETEEEMFIRAYHSIMNLSIARELVFLEQSFAFIVSKQIDMRDAQLSKLEKDVIAEIEQLRRKANTPNLVTQLLARHSQERGLLLVQWNSCISGLKHIQKKTIRELAISVYESLFGQYRDNEKEVWNLAVESLVPTSALRPTQDPYSGASHVDKSVDSHSDAQITWSENYTVQCGRQLRTACTIRLVRADPLDALTGHKEDPENHEDLAQRLSNAFSIYGNETSGLVLIVDKNVNVSRGVNQRLSAVCDRSTEFHFPEYDRQLEGIRQTVSRVNRHAPSSATPDPSVSAERGTADLNSGDIYITQHSNLAGDVFGGLAGRGGGLGVVFHLVMEEQSPTVSSERISGGEETTINERRLQTSASTLHCALASIVRLCCDYDITTLSLPLFLVPSLREHMDRGWRRRRAETVFKAFKGVLIDMASWYGDCLHLVQFFASPGLIDDEELQELGQLVLTSFLKTNVFFAPSTAVVGTV